MEKVDFDVPRRRRVYLLWAAVCAMVQWRCVFSLNEEGSVLLNWKHNFVEDVDDSMNNWNASDTNPCLWNGVNCTQGSVSAIDFSPLAFCNLVGDISALRLAKFGNLTTLNVGNTSLSGNFPADVVECSKLVYLNMSYTSIAGELPENLTSLQHLQVLDVTGDYCEGVVVTRFDELPELRFLGLGDNYFEGPVPESILNVKKLEGLTLALNDWNGTLPLGFFTMPNLKQLWLGSNLGFPNLVPWPNVSIWEGIEDLRLVGVRFPRGPFPPAILKLTTLRSLHLERCNLTGPIPSINTLPLLEFLNLGNNTLSGPIPDMFGGMPMLERVWLFENQLTGPLPPSLFRLSGVWEIVFFINFLDGDLSGLANLRDSLKWVDISYNHVSGEIPASVGNFTRLKYLCLSNNSFSGQIPASLGNLRVLDSLRLSANNLSGPIPASLGNLTNLSTMELGYNNLSGPIPVEIADFELLTYIHFESNQLTGEIPYNLGRNALLEFVDFGTNHLEGPVPPYLCWGNTLTFLMLSGNRLTGTIPETYGNCSNLGVLRLDDNQLEGPVPAGLWAGSSLWRMQLSGNNLGGTIDASIGSAKSLAILLMQDNKFSGSIPAEIGQTSLVKFRADSNEFNGTLPPLLGNLTSLTQLTLGGNSFQGAIPANLGNCTELFQLDLSGNRLTGAIPEELADLDKLSTLDVSQNDLSGPIPQGLFSMANLQILNVAFNNLSGIIPNQGNGPAFVSVNFTGNPYLCVEGSCGSSSSAVVGQPPHSGGSQAWMVVLAVFGGVAVVLLAVVAAVFWRCRSRRMKSALSDAEEEDVWTLTSFTGDIFRANEVTALKEENVIGAGGSGRVYKVTLSHGETVAVKKLWNVAKEERSKDHGFETEVRTLASIHHQHIVQLLCCCTNRDCNLLVYEYEPKGSLGDALHGPRAEALSWEIRHKIAVGAAMGLEFLHHECNPQILHRDIKSNNILLDLDYEASLTDFGIAKIVETTAASHTLSTIAGSLGYMAPEYSFSTRVNEKIDVYSFGVVLLELATGKRAIDPSIYGEAGTNLVQWVTEKAQTAEGTIEILDPKCEGSSPEAMVALLRLGLACTSFMAARRPSMRDVVARLVDIAPKSCANTVGDNDGSEDGIPDTSRNS